MTTILATIPRYRCEMGYGASTFTAQISVTFRLAVTFHPAPLQPIAVLFHCGLSYYYTYNGRNPTRRTVGISSKNSVR